MNVMTQNKYEIGKTYNINHSRKGKFGIIVTGQCDTWLSGTVVGTAGAMMEYNVKDDGESITVRKSLITVVGQS